MDKHFDANRPCQAVSKQFIKHYKPENQHFLSLLTISMTNSNLLKNVSITFTYSNYVDVCWLYFDDIGYIPFGDKSLNMFTKKPKNSFNSLITILKQRLWARTRSLLCRC